MSKNLQPKKEGTYSNKNTEKLKLYLEELKKSDAKRNDTADKRPDPKP
jgi:hypothetical protein